MRWLVVALMAALAVSRARAVLYTVSDDGDAGPGTLRQALLLANANAGPDQVCARAPWCPF